MAGNESDSSSFRLEKQEVPMHQLSLNHLAALLAQHEPPCVSLYQPTHRSYPASQQDPIRYRNLLREMEASMRQKYPTRNVRAILEKFQRIATDELFWNHRTEGLAILSSGDLFEIFELQRPVRELLVVAESFHAKPLLRVLQSADRYQVLCLNRHAAKLYQGNRDALDPVDLAEVPATITEALGEELTEPHQAVRSIPGQASLHHGRGQRKDEIEVDMLRFFRIIDRAILERHSRPSGLPLVLAALAEYHAPFRAVSHNPFLLADGISMNPEALSLDELRVQAWQKMEPLYLNRLARLVENFQVARSRQMGSDNLAQVAQATMGGRVGTLLVEADRQIPGRIDPATGRMDPGDLSHPEIDDLLDDLAEAVLRRKGEVVVVPAERMPTDTGVAATYRF